MRHTEVDVPPTPGRMPLHELLVIDAVASLAYVRGYEIHAVGQPEDAVLINGGALGEFRTVIWLADAHRGREIPERTPVLTFRPSSSGAYGSWTFGTTPAESQPPATSSSSPSVSDSSGSFTAPPCFVESLSRSPSHNVLTGHAAGHSMRTEQGAPVNDFSYDPRVPAPLRRSSGRLSHDD